MYVKLGWTARGAVVLALASAIWGTSAESQDPCHVRTGNPDVVPCLRVPHCESRDGPAMIHDFYLSTPPIGLKPPQQRTEVEVCYDEHGILVRTHAFDTDVFSNATKCNDPVFALGDVLEVFIGPVEDPTDDPDWYHEIDTGASGALWAAQQYNPPEGTAFKSHGNVSNCNRSTLWTPCHPGMLNCTGLANFGELTARVAATADGWKNELIMPWTIFKQPFLRHGEVPPWSLWRGNFYRYDYPNLKNKTDYELSGWSPTHNPSFHTPSRFGVIVLESFVE